MTTISATVTFEPDDQFRPYVWRPDESESPEAYAAGELGANLIGDTSLSFCVGYASPDDIIAAIDNLTAQLATLREAVVKIPARPVERDPGDHFIRTDPCDIDGDERCRTHGGRFDGKDYRRCSKAPVAA